MIRFLRISPDHPLYPQELALRSRILLEPIGYDMRAFHQEFPGFEERFEHFVAVLEHPSGPTVVGVVTLLPHYPHPGSGKLMQMAVDPQRQGEGIGRRLVVELERRAFGELALEELYCHAQSSAVGFYRQLGWEPDGPTFDEAGIEHQKMRFRPGPMNPHDEPEIPED